MELDTGSAVRLNGGNGFGQLVLRAVALSPDDAFAHYYLGRVHLDAQHYEEAFRELKQSRVEWPADPEFMIAAATG